MRLFVRGLVLAAFLCSFFIQTTTASADVLHDSLMSAINSYRASRGLPTVTASPTLQAAAQFMADDIAAHGVPVVPHVSSDGRAARQRMADAGYPVDASWTSEIIAWGASASSGAMSLWLNSAPHTAVLNDGRYVAGGFGVACYGTYPCVWVATFGSIVDRGFGAPVAPSYHAAFAAEAAFPVASPGQTVQWVIAFTNTGGSGWSLGAANPLRLGTDHPQDLPSGLATTKWITTNRPAQQTTSYVGPGQQAWFIVELVAPSAPGTYRLYVRPVIDGVQWLEDAGAYVDLVVR